MEIMVQVAGGSGEYTIASQKVVANAKNLQRFLFEGFMARPKGFEPSTYRFVAGHSIR